MASNKEGDSSLAAGDAQLLYNSLEQYNQEQKREKRPSLILVALLFLFLSSGGGITLAVVLLLEPIEAQAACLSRDLILFAAGLTLLYIGLHIRGARKNYRRSGPGPPQIYGNYLHASALLAARLAIAIWVAALVTTAVMIAKAPLLKGFVGKAPILNLLVCIAALFAFVVVSVTIEKHPTPFATAAISRASFLTCRVSDFEEDLRADLSVSRRASLQRKESQNGSIVTLPSEEIFRLGASKSATKQGPLAIVIQEIDDDKTELMAESPGGLWRNTDAFSTSLPSSALVREDVPPVPKLPEVLEATYNPGGWKEEWNDVAEKDDLSRLKTESTIGSSVYASNYSSATTASMPGVRRTKSRDGKARATWYRGTETTSTTVSNSSRGRSNPSTSRQPTKASRKPIYSVASTIETKVDGKYEDGRVVQHRIVEQPTPATLLRNAQRAQKGGFTNKSDTTKVSKKVAPPPQKGLRRKPSNFSRPMTSAKKSDRDVAVDAKIPGAFDF